MVRFGFGRLVLAIGLAIAVLPGCTRSSHRLRADRLAYCVLDEQTAFTPWHLPNRFSVMPDVRSRFYDPSCIDDPALPYPAPKLYEYCLPRLPDRDPSRFRQSLSADSVAHSTGSLRASSTQRPMTALVDAGSYTGPHDVVTPDLNAGATSPDLIRLPTRGDPERPNLERLPPVNRSSAAVKLVNYHQLLPDGLQTDANAPPSVSDIAAETVPAGEMTEPTVDELQDGLRIVAIPATTWESLPNSCLLRMLEFRSVRAEYERTFQRPPTADDRDDSPRLALEDIMEQALINNRAYQSQKESLYAAALCLSLERFAYEIKFSPFGNGSALNFTHDRSAGITENTLAIPSRAQLEKMLITGGDFLIGFANNVLLTFNGPAGFTSEVSSSIVAEFSQTLLQIDVKFESLTQAERDVVYEARRFARFRKQLFRDLAVAYYELLLTYRAIEIDSQDYFSNLRGFIQGQAEYRAGRLPRFQVDQFEQDALASRSNLIGSCNALEDSFDRLKLSVGLPPEIPINLDLRELEELTLRDEATVAGELVRRAQRNLIMERQQPDADSNVLLNGAIDLARRTLNLLELREQLGQEAQAGEDVKRLWAEMQVDEAEMLVELNRRVLAEDAQATPPAPPLRLFQRTMDVIDSQLTVVGRQLEWLELQRESATNQLNRANVRRALENLQRQYRALETELAAAVELRDLDRIPTLVRQATDLLAAVDRLAERAAAVGPPRPETGAPNADAVLRSIDESIAASRSAMSGSVAGLTPIELDMDDAMLTALAQRFDLMNERGALADEWRQIKLAGDDLRSILNLNAGFQIDTDSTRNDPFRFTFDDSRTTLGLTFDAPLNRRAQAKTYRLALIDYNAALRRLIEFEDTIKVEIRDNLRRLRLDREQYAIAVASAALAQERVVSTRLQLRLGVQNVAARDVLESQQAYTASLSAVARQHISYVLGRIQLFLDLELLQVDETGFWPELYNENYAPLPNWNYPINAGFAYGNLPACVLYSDCMRRMEGVPFGQSQIGECPTYDSDSSDEQAPPPADETPNEPEPPIEDT